jgi:sulfur carrier protein ThiS
MSITLLLRKQKFEIEEEQITVKEALERLELSPQRYLVVKGEKLLGEEDVLVDGDVVRIAAVISGGGIYKV